MRDEDYLIPKTAQDILRQVVVVRLEDDREIRCSLDEITVIKES